jgi:hypothetical protein
MGLVPLRRYEDTVRRVRDLTRDRGDWKKRATKGARRERLLEQRARDLEKKLQKALQRQNRPISTDAHPPADDQPRALATVHAPLADAVAIEARLAETERALATARDHLNAIEVKLQILEGAANVLDARTRTATQRQQAKTGAAVS